MVSEDTDAPLLVIAGPTASGKTDLALALAKRLGGELISADSMQVYRDLPVLTARPKPDELQGIACHLSGHVGRTEQYHVQRFVNEADAAVADIRSRGRIPIVCGGTGLYIRGFLRGIFHSPAVDPSIRQGLEAELERPGGVERLREELERVDREAFLRIHPADHVRLVRALEIWRGTGESITRLQKQFESGSFRYLHRLIVLRWPVDVLNERIHMRTCRMVNSGLLEEVAQFLESGGSSDHPVFRALGAEQVVSHLRGEKMLSEMIADLAQITRQYARRQRTWFRGESGSRYLDLVGEENWDRLAESVLDSLDCSARRSTNTG